MNQRGSKVRIYAKLPAKTNLEFVGAVTSDDYKLIRNRIIGHGEGGLKYLVSTLLQKAGWDAKRDERNIFAPVTEIFMQTPDVDLKRFAQFVAEKEKRKFFTPYLHNHKVFNLYDMFNDGLNGIYPPESIKYLTNELWSITTCINQVGIGPGEICLSTLTHSSKGLQGDLVLSDIGEVEVKSSFGRLGSGDNSSFFAERIRDMFSAKQLSIDAVRKKRITQGIKLNCRAKTDGSWSWNEALKSFFHHKWGFSESAIILALTYLSTQKLSVNSHGRLVAALKKLTPIIIPKIQQGDRDELIRIVLTIQLCTYQNDHEFSHLLCINKQTKDAFPIYFSNGLEKSVKSVYDQLTHVKRISSNLAIDSEGTRKGVEINFV